MIFCEQCFKSNEIKEMIRSGKKKGNCELNNAHKSVHIFDTTEDVEVSMYVKEFLRQIIDLYSIDSELPNNFKSGKLKLLKDSLEKDWPIFEINNEEIYEFLDNLFNDASFDNELLENRVGITEEVDEDNSHLLIRGNSWDAFVEEITYQNRFHQDLINLENLEHFITKSYEKLNVSHSLFYRSRISNEKALEISEMSAPPENLATSGRLNADFISTLYLSDDKETTLQEVRAAFHDTVYMGTFKILKDELVVANLCEDFQVRIFDNSKDDDFLKYYLNRGILEKITDELTKPTNENTKSRSYIPLQYISDFIKSHYLNFDGILYNSVMKKGKKNLLLFDKSLAECINLEESVVEEVTYRTHEIVD